MRLDVTKPFFIFGVSLNFKFTFWVSPNNFLDNKPAISLTGNSYHNSQTKHIEIQWHYIWHHIWEQVKNSSIKIEYISTKNMPSKSLTKPLQGIDLFGQAFIKIAINAILYVRCPVLLSLPSCIVPARPRYLPKRPNSCLNTFRYIFIPKGAGGWIGNIIGQGKIGHKFERG